MINCTALVAYAWGEHLIFSMVTVNWQKHKTEKPCGADLNEGKKVFHYSKEPSDVSLADVLVVALSNAFFRPL